MELPYRVFKPLPAAPHEAVIEAALDAGLDITDVIKALDALEDELEREELEEDSLQSTGHCPVYELCACCGHSERVGNIFGDTV